MFFASAASQTQVHGLLHGIYVILKGKSTDFTVLQGVFTCLEHLYCKYVYVCV